MRAYSHLWRGEEEKYDDVGAHQDDPETIDGGHDDAVRLHDPVVSPEVRVEELEYVRDALELLRRPLPHDMPKRFPENQDRPDPIFTMSV